LGSFDVFSFFSFGGVCVPVNVGKSGESENADFENS